MSRQRELADPETDARMYRREVELYVAYSATWRSELPAGYTAALVAARRGFWHRASAPATAILAAPDNPFAQLIDELNVGYDFSVADLEGILRLPHAPRFVSLSMSGRGSTVGAAGARALASARLNRLELLWLDRQAIGDAGVRALCAAPFLALRELHLHENGITDAGAEALLSSGLPMQLRKLSLRGNAISPEAAASLAVAFPHVAFDL